MKDLAGDAPYQVVARRSKSAEKAAHFIQLNHDVDMIIAAGLAQDVTALVKKPEGFTDQFRVIGVTRLGMTMFGTDENGKGLTAEA